MCAVCIWLLLLSVTYLRFVRVAAYISSLVVFFFWLLKSSPLYESITIYSFICWWTFELSPVLDIVVKSVSNISVQVFIWTYLAFLLGKCLWVELLGLKVSVCLTWFETVKQFSKELPCFVLPPVMYETSSCSTHLATSVIGCSGISLYSGFLFWWWLMILSFISLLAIHISSFVSCLFKSFVSIFKFCVQPLNFKGCLYSSYQTVKKERKRNLYLPLSPSLWLFFLFS